MWFSSRLPFFVGYVRLNHRYLKIPCAWVPARNSHIGCGVSLELSWWSCFHGRQVQNPSCLSLESEIRELWNPSKLSRAPRFEMQCCSIVHGKLCVTIMHFALAMSNQNWKHDVLILDFSLTWWWNWMCGHKYPSKLEIFYFWEVRMAFHSHL